MDLILPIVSVILSILCLLVLLVLLFRKPKKETAPSVDMESLLEKQNARFLAAVQEKLSGTDALLKNQLDALKENLSLHLENMRKGEADRGAALEKLLSERILGIEKTIKDSLNGLDSAFRLLSENQEKRLSEIQGIVNEKLEKALDERLANSFKNISEQLTGVYKAVGEMTRIGQDVSSLKRVLTNVKTTGILGEVQLSNILEEILTPEQYATNIATKRNSRDVVEFAVRLPGRSSSPVYLPIDSKFPLTAYESVVKAREQGDKEALESSRKDLRTRILLFSKDIEEKYIDVPGTTDFAILFLPIESLYEEVLSLGLLEECQRKHHIVLAGPSTLSAFLNALAMGFKTVAIEKKTDEVFTLLGKVKQEFGKFSEVLSQALRSLDQTRNRLEDLVGKRTRSIEASLRTIELPSPEESREKAPALGEDVPLE